MATTLRAHRSTISAIGWRGLLAVSMALGGASCAGTGRELTEEEARAVMPDDWLGHALHVRPPQMFELGEVEISDALGGSDQVVMVVDAPGDEWKDEESLTLGVDGKEYEVYLQEDAAFDAEVAARLDEDLANAAAALGLLEEDASPLPGERKGIVGWRDTRQRMGIADGHSKTSWLATIGQLTTTNYNSTTCTGTLVKPNVVLTAAHCLVKKSSSGGYYIRTAAFHPRADGTGTSDGRYPRGNWTWDIHRLRRHQLLRDYARVRQ